MTEAEESARVLGLAERLEAVTAERDACQAEVWRLLELVKGLMGDLDAARKAGGAG